MTPAALPLSRKMISLKDKWSFWGPHWMTVLSGLLMTLSFPPFSLWPLLWIILIPWFFCLQKTKDLRAALVQGVWFGFFISIGITFWVAYVLREFGNLPWSISILGLVLFSFFGQPQAILLAPLFKALHNQNERSPVRNGLLLGLTYCAIDWFFPKLFVDTLGHGLYKARHLRQLADLTGALGLTFLIFLVNYTLWISLQQFRAKKFQFQLIHGITLGLCIAGYSYGYLRFSSLDALLKSNSRGFQAAAIQGNIGDFDKVAAESGVSAAAFKVLDIFKNLTDQALALPTKPELVIWPETSFPATFRKPHNFLEYQLDQRIDDFISTRKFPLLFGGYDHENGKDFNSFFFLSAKGELQTYHKAILLLFGEYIPGADHLTLIKDLFPQVGNFGRGEGPKTIEVSLTQNKDLKSVKVAPIICYEALFSNHVIDSANKGSDVIINITNDSWFGPWGEPQLHLALSTFRSIETRLPMIRTTNTGISALILPNGEITHPTEIGRPEILNVFVPVLEPTPTLLKRWGDWFGPFSFLLSLLGISIVLVRKSLF